VVLKNRWFNLIGHKKSTLSRQQRERVLFSVNISENYVIPDAIAGACPPLGKHNNSNNNNFERFEFSFL